MALVPFQTSRPVPSQRRRYDHFDRLFDNFFNNALTNIGVQPSDAVVRLEVRYLAPEMQEYRDLWVLRFAPDGRVERFEEWPYWPGRSYTASDGA